MQSKKGKSNTDDYKLKLIVFKACHVAVWVDLNGDGRVTGEDLRELAYNWLMGFE